MPDPPPSKLRPPRRTTAPPPTDHCEAPIALGQTTDATSTLPAGGRDGGTVELFVRSNFSFLQAASHPEELVEHAAALGLDTIAITDVHSLAGAVRAHAAARQHGVKLIVGAEIRPDDAAPAVLWAADRKGYANLCRLITVGRRAAPKGRAQILFQDIAAHAAGLLAGVRVRGMTDAAALETATRPYRDVFGDRCHVLAEFFGDAHDDAHAALWTTFHKRTGIPLVAAGAVLQHHPQRRSLLDVLTAIRLNTSVQRLGRQAAANAERHLLSPHQRRDRFRRLPGALSRAREIADHCNFSLEELRYEYPRELCPDGLTPIAYLRRLVDTGANRRYPQGVPARVRRLLEHELNLIEELHYEPYFLTVYDLVRFARQRGILCQGRGSAANSAVCYCLGITSVDPEHFDVLFERFVSRERNEAPDIDVDFEHERREEIIQYIYRKYGRERAAMTATVITYRMKSAVRDVGRALDLAPDTLDHLSRLVDNATRPDQLPEKLRQAGLGPQTRVGRLMSELVPQLLGFPRHLSQHVGGMVITDGPLCELVPIENAAMPDRTVIQWDKDDLDSLGLLKVDCLSLGMLTAIHKAFDLIERHDQRRLSLANIPHGDPRVYDMICRADTIGVFQIESRAQMSMLPRLKPRCFYDLVIEVAIVRPGPIQGDMVHPYLRRRCGEEPVEYPDERIRAVLEKTLGVPIFQEQAMRLAVVAAGFTPGEADQLRRAMGAWRRPGLIDRFRRKLVDGMRQRGYDPEFAERLFRQIRGFGEYGFPESHAASFALLVYVSAWLKHYYPAVFTAALLNSQPMGFYAPAQLIRDARDHGVVVRPPDVNASHWDCTLEPLLPPPDRVEPLPSNPDAVRPSPRRNDDHPPPADQSVAPPRVPLERRLALRLGLRLVRGLPRSAAERIERVRGEGGPFESIEEFIHRTGLPGPVVQELARADAFASLCLDRRQALWAALAGTSAGPLWSSLANRPAGHTPPPRGTPPVRRMQSPHVAAGSRFVERPAEPGSHHDHPQTADALPPLEPLSPFEEVVQDYHHLGLSLRQHPLRFLRAWLTDRKVVPAARLARLQPGRLVRVAGLVLLRQRPGSARGITFVSIEDETGIANLIIRQDVWDRYDVVARSAPAVIATGHLQIEHDVVHVLVTALHDLSPQLARIRHQSRDFR
ncbi:MAG: DNA polymerase III subunit alpha [Planctomycetota bacterium]|nr:MAG: DNA polymerase III subunit alpha [Planctomycetota bacterium]